MSTTRAVVTRLGAATSALIATGLWSLASAASTIDATQRFAYAANFGWIDARGDGALGGAMGEYVLSGWLWAANVGWIGLGNGVPADGIDYGNASAADYGVNVLAGAGTMAPLRGQAYGANIGWINFEATGNPRIDLMTGAFRGYAWSANCGWINLGELGVPLRTTAIQRGADTDGDGIADAFEFLHTGGLSQMNATSDLDGDGTLDSAEAAADTDPLDPASGLRITDFATTADSLQSTLTWTSRPTRQYRIFQTDALASPWQLTLDNLDAAGPLTTRTVTNAPPVPAPTRRFFRVQAFQPLLTP